MRLGADPVTGAARWLALVDGLCVLRTARRDEAVARAVRASIGRITTCCAVACVGDPAALRWYRNELEVTP